MRIEFSIPAIPPSINKWSRSHWSVRANHAKDWYDWVALHAPLAPQKRLLIDPAIVTLTFASPYKIDGDNRAKFVLDGLVKRGLITDDSAPHLAELRLRTERRRLPQTLIVIESV